jgi:hypothetical protein
MHHHLSSIPLQCQHRAGNYKAENSSKETSCTQRTSRNRRMSFFLVMTLSLIMAFLSHPVYPLFHCTVVSSPNSILPAIVEPCELSLSLQSLPPIIRALVVPTTTSEFCCHYLTTASASHHQKWHTSQNLRHSQAAPRLRRSKCSLMELVQIR